MITVNALSEVAALMGDPARAAMLQLLMDGRAHTASELALTAGVTAQTASGHLSRMIDGNLLAARAQGRNRFYRLATPDVAHAIESLMAVAGTGVSPAAKTAAWRRDPDLRFCRTCYDHLAGQVGIAVTDSLTRAGHIEPKRSARLEAHGVGRAVLPEAGRRRAGRAPRRHPSLRPPVPRLERAAAAHLGRAGGGHRRHLLHARLGRAAPPQPHRAAHRFRTTGDGQPLRRHGLTLARQSTDADTTNAEPLNGWSPAPRWA